MGRRRGESFSGSGRERWSRLTTGVSYLSFIAGSWSKLTRGDRIVLLLVETAVCAICIAVFASANDWLTIVVIVGFVFLAFQFIVFLVVQEIATWRRNRTATATPKKSWRKRATNLGVGLLTWAALAFLYMAGGYAAEWMFPESEWATKWRYGLADDLKDADYVMEKHPHNCEFMSAPMGSKHCHYDKEVGTIRIRIRNGGREMSNDDGTTWSNADAGTRARVFVSWTKIQD